MKGESEEFVLFFFSFFPLSFTLLGERKKQSIKRLLSNAFQLYNFDEFFPNNIFDNFLIFLYYLKKKSRNKNYCKQEDIRREQKCLTYLLVTGDCTKLYVVDQKMY